jgi:hypothetical protein
MVVRAVIVALLAVGGFFYVLFGPLVFDAVYWLLGKIVRVQADRRVRIGVSLVLAVVYLASMEYIGYNEKPATEPGATSTTAIAAAASPTASAAPASPTVAATSAATATPVPTPSATPTSAPTSTPSPTATATPTRAPTPTPRPTVTRTPWPLPTFPTLLSLSGTGIKSSNSFNWSGHSIDVDYSFNCSNFGTKGNFILMFYGANSLGPTIPDILVNVVADKGGSTTTEYLHYLSGSSGPFHVDVNSECQWALTVTGIP